MENSSIAIFISIFALVFSIIQFYYYRWKRAELKMFVGPRILIAGHPNMLAFTIPITINNSGASIGKINQITLSLKSKDNFYVTKWANFKNLTSDGGMWVQKNIAHNIIVQGYSSVTEMVEFCWNIFPFDGLHSEKVEFVFTFWTDTDKKSVSETFKFSPTNSEHITLMDLIEKVDKGTISVKNVIYFDLDSKLKSNQILTEHEFKKIIS